MVVSFSFFFVWTLSLDLVLLPFWGVGLRGHFDLFCPRLVPGVMVKLTCRATGHFVTLTESGIHLTECNPRHISKASAHCMIFLCLCSLSDVNECADGTSGCAQVCRNTPGSYVCGCRRAYTLNPNGRTCDGMHFLFPLLCSFTFS